MNSDKKNRGIIVFLLLLIVTIGILSYLNARDYSILKEAFQEEKQELESELDKIIVDYDNALSGKIELTRELREKRLKITSLRDSLKGLEEKNYSQIRRYRNRISVLEKQNRELFAKVDSLNTENHNLQEENLAVKEELTQKNLLASRLTKTNNSLQKTKENLEKKVSKAEELEIDDLSVTPMKKRSNGDYTSTSRHRKAEAFKVSYDILKNDIAKKGVRKAYVQIIDMDKNIISADGYTILKSGSKMVYSDAFTINYDNHETNIVNLSEVTKGYLKRGKYTINLFLEGKLMGNRTITLK